MSRVSAVALIVAMTGALAALGGVTVATALGAAALMLVVAGTHAAARPRLLALPARLAAAGLVLAAAVPALQLVRLPAGLLRALAPANEALWRGAERAVGVASSARPISLDPSATQFQLAAALLALAAFLAASRAAAGRDGRALLSNGVLVAVGVTIVIAWGHTALGLRAAYGMYAPQHPIHVGLTVLGPLLNPNHLAAVAAVGIPLALGHARGAPTSLASAGYTALAGACAVTVAATLSRAGIVVAAAELVAFPIVVRLAAAEEPRRGAASTTLPALGMLAVGVAFVAPELLQKQFHVSGFSKMELVARAYRLVREHPWVGVGRGAFGAAFARHEGEPLPQFPAAGISRYSHAEHWPAQLMTELGVPLAVVLALLLAAAFVLSSRRAVRTPTGAGAVIALAGLVGHDLFDFSMEFAGVAILAATLMALVTSEVRRSSSTRSSRPTIEREGSRLRVALGYAPVACVLVAALALFSARGRIADEEAAVLSTEWRGGRLAASEAVIDGAVLRHPVDPYPALLHAVVAMRRPEAGSRFVRAIELGPWRAQTHYWFARWLLTSGRVAQAGAEYREAARLSSAFATVCVDDLVDAGASVDELLAFPPNDVVLDHAADRLVARGRPADAHAVDAALLARFSPAANARAREIALLRAEGKLDDARAEARRLVELVPAKPAGYLALADLARDAAESEAILQGGVGRVPDSPDLLARLIRLKAKRLGSSAVRAELAALRERYVAAGVRVGAANAVESEILLEEGKWSLALGQCRAIAIRDEIRRGCLEKVRDAARNRGISATVEAAEAALLDPSTASPPPPAEEGSAVVPQAP